MALKTRRYLIVLTVLAVLAGGFLVPVWLGPKLPGYRLEERPLVQTVVATGRIASVSTANVGSEITAVVLERRVEEGDAVAVGDVLAVLRADDLAAQERAAAATLQNLIQSTRPQAQEALREAEARLEQADREATRRQDLFERGLIAREALEQAEETRTVARAAAATARLRAAAVAAGGAEETVLREQLLTARAALNKTELRSEVDGIVLTRNAEPGDTVQPGTVLFQIARNGNTEVLVPFDEENLALLRMGQLATCIADAFPARPFAARITLIAPRIDSDRGTVDVRLRVEPVPDFLRQDMTVSVNVETGRREQALVIPNDALLSIDSDHAEVLVVRDGRVQRTDIRLGLTGLTLTEVVSGLKAGDTVLQSAAASRVAADDRVRPIELAVPADSQPSQVTDRTLYTP